MTESVTIQEVNAQIYLFTSGNVTGGLPPFTLPPFGTTFNGTTFTFGEMVKEYGTIIVFCPLVAILEQVAIAKAFCK